MSPVGTEGCRVKMIWPGVDTSLDVEVRKNGTYVTVSAVLVKPARC